MLRQYLDPVLALAISDILLHWRNWEELHPIQMLIWNLQPEIDSQYIISWYNLCFGLVSKHIKAVQQSFLKDLGYKYSGAVCMSKVVRIIWDLQKIMWDHSNSYVHASNNTIHYYEEEYMTATIWLGFAVGKNGLPAAYPGLYTGKVQLLLKDKGITKYQWLRSIWNVRGWVRIKKAYDVGSTTKY